VSSSSRLLFNKPIEDFFWLFFPRSYVTVQGVWEFPWASSCRATGASVYRGSWPVRFLSCVLLSPYSPTRRSGCQGWRRHERSELGLDAKERLSVTFEAKGRRAQDRTGWWREGLRGVWAGLVPRGTPWRAGHRRVGQRRETSHHGAQRHQSPLERGMGGRTAGCRTIQDPAGACAAGDAGIVSGHRRGKPGPGFHDTCLSCGAQIRRIIGGMVSGQILHQHLTETGWIELPAG
jgi:hypothetical protein